MATKKDGRANNGGPRKNAGRKRGIPKKKITVSVVEDYADEIKEKTVKLSKAYERLCPRKKQ